MTMENRYYRPNAQVQQFRPPVDSYTAELPAGLIDKGETAEEATASKSHGKTWEKKPMENDGKWMNMGFSR